jgi:hypothetical protein
VATQVSAPPSQPGVIAAMSISCSKLADCLPPHQPKCTTGTPSCTNGLCVYTPFNALCLPPDVTYCDPSADASHVDCNMDGGVYPSNPAICGTRECLTDAAASSCFWGGCVAPSH